MPDIDSLLAQKYAILQQQADAGTLQAKSGANLENVRAGLLPGETAANIANTQANTLNTNVQARLAPGLAASTIGYQGALGFAARQSGVYSGAQTTGLGIENEFYKRNPDKIGTGGMPSTTSSLLDPRSLPDLTSLTRR